MARVLWRDAQGKEGTVTLANLEVRIGRAADCEICTEDGMVSRYHARILRRGPGYLIEDLGSANGIFFEERQVASHHLSHGDAVRCGSLWIRFVQEDGPRAGAGPAPAEAARGVHGTMVLDPPRAPVSLAPSRGATPETLPEQPRPMASAPDQAGGDEAAHELRLLRRRVQQLQLELRNVRANKMSAQQAQGLQELEEELFAVVADRDELRRQIEDLRGQLDARAMDASLRRADELSRMAVEASQQLADLMASLRVELIAASDEFEQYRDQLPRASFELIRQAMRDAATFAEKSRQLVRDMAALDDTGAL